VTREERNQLLDDLRAAGVQQAEFLSDGRITRVSFGPAPTSPAAAADERMPRPKRTADERLFGPLGIDDKGGG
jgi:hypothetical protein